MRRLVLVLSILIVIGALAYAFYALQSRPAATPSVVEEVPVYPVSFERTYDEGVHTIEGVVRVETPCQEVTATASVVASGIRVEVTVAPNQGICLQRPQDVAFSTDVEAPEEAAVAVFVNGIAASSL